MVPQKLVDKGNLCLTTNVECGAKDTTEQEYLRGEFMVVVPFVGAIRGVMRGYGHGSTVINRDGGRYGGRTMV